MNGKSTKEILLEAGEAIILEKGYNHTGIQEVVTAAGVPKGSFYHFFENKETFGREVLENYMQKSKAVSDAIFNDETCTPLAKLRNFFESKITYFNKEHGCKGGCMVGNFAQEMADQNSTFQKILQHAMQHSKGDIATTLEAAQTYKEISQTIDTKAMAEFLFNGWEGALLHMKVEGNVQPLRNYVAMVFGTILVS